MFAIFVLDRNYYVFVLFFCLSVSIQKVDVFVVVIKCFICVIIFCVMNSSVDNFIVVQSQTTVCVDRRQTEIVYAVADVTFSASFSVFVCNAAEVLARVCI